MKKKKTAKAQHIGHKTTDDDNDIESDIVIIFLPIERLCRNVLFNVNCLIAKRTLYMIKAVCFKIIIFLSYGKIYEWHP
jgi:hypothetical protein